jgi:hypothetical protein
VTHGLSVGKAEKIGLWIYCVIPNVGELKWDCLGIHGTSPVRAIASGKFAAIVSEEPMKKYHLDRDYLLTHQRVIETVMADHRVLPVKFCTIGESQEKIVRDVLVPKAYEFQERFAEIEGKDEYGLRVSWKDPEEVFREVGETNEKVRRKKAEILALPESKRRSELIDIGHLIKEAVQEVNESLASEIKNQLTFLACDSKVQKTIGDRLILNSSYLVCKKDQVHFDQAVQELDNTYGSRLLLKYVGPVPPFNFIEIVIRWKEESSSFQVSKSLS